MTTMTNPPAPATAPARRKRRVFMWVFLAIQVLFLAWLIIGLVTIQTGPSHADLVSGCYNGNWQGLFKSQHDCVVHYGGALNTAGQAGKAIGAGLVIGLWVAVDVILGVGRLVVVTSRRRHEARPVA
jgi:hypothetical protein